MKTGSKLLSPAMSIFDKIKEFFGIVVLGFIVNKLPKIIKAITDFLNSEFVKNLKSVVSVIEIHLQHYIILLPIFLNP